MPRHELAYEACITGGSWKKSAVRFSFLVPLVTLAALRMWKTAASAKSVDVHHYVDGPTTQFYIVWQSVVSFEDVSGGGDATPFLGTGVNTSLHGSCVAAVAMAWFPRDVGGKHGCPGMF